MNVSWLVTAILIGIEERVVVQQASRTTNRNWQMKSLGIVVQVNPIDTESKVVADMRQQVIVENGIPQCYKCGLKGLVRADSTPPPVKAKERHESEKVVCAPLSVDTGKKHSKESETEPQTRTSTSKHQLGNGGKEAKEDEKEDM